MAKVSPKLSAESLVSRVRAMGDGRGKGTWHSKLSPENAKIVDDLRALYLAGQLRDLSLAQVMREFQNETGLKFCYATFRRAIAEGVQ